MAEIVNLRRARKAKARAEHDRAARANRAAFGRPGAERRRAEAERDLARDRLDGHRIDIMIPEDPDPAAET